MANEEPGTGGGGARKRVESFEELDVFKAARALFPVVYESSKLFPSEERFGITSQIRRAATSVMCNIAEGWGRGQSQANVNFVRTARGSLAEVKCLLLSADDLDFVSPEAYQSMSEKLDSTFRLLNRYLSSLERNLVREETSTYAAGHDPR